MSQPRVTPDTIEYLAEAIKQQKERDRSMLGGLLLGTPKPPEDQPRISGAGLDVLCEPY